MQRRVASAIWYFIECWWMLIAANHHKHQQYPEYWDLNFAKFQQGSPGVSNRRTCLYHRRFTPNKLFIPKSRYKCQKRLYAKMEVRLVNINYWTILRAIFFNKTPAEGKPSKLIGVATFWTCFSLYADQPNTELTNLYI